MITTLKFDDAIRSMGVPDRELTQMDRDQLDRDGFVILRDVLSARQIDDMCAVLDRLLVAEGDRAGIEMHQEAGTERLADLLYKDAIFDVCFQTTRVLTAVQHVLGEFQLSELVSRFALPGYGKQGLHADAQKDEHGTFTACNTFWLLDDFTDHNGGTRVVPGSHTRGMPQLDDPNAHSPDEIQIVAPAGSVVIFNAHLMHAGALNRSDKRRRAISAFYTTRAQPSNIWARHRPEAITRFTQSERVLFGEH